MSSRRKDRWAPRMRGAGWLWVALAVLCGLVASTPARAQGFGSFISPGPLSYDHADIDTVTGCTNCHSPGSGPSPDRCMTCHESVKKQVSTKVGFHARRATACGKCHGEHKGKDRELIPIISKNDATFDHRIDTGWALEGEHDRIGCEQCHKTPRKYIGLDPECTSCHQDPHGANLSRRPLLKNCDTCHDANDWDALPLSATVFDHTRIADADYLLDGEHLEVDCVDCHFEMKFVPVEHATCVSCHVNTHRASFKNEACTSCHPNASTWAVPGFDHDRAQYHLAGQHTKVACDDCHEADKTEPLAFQRCDNCHMDIHRNQFAPRGCDACHTVQTARFALRDYDHAQTEYPLIGKHAEQECEECHQDRDKAVYVNLAHDDCDACHDDAHAGRFEPTACDTCHIPDGFHVQAFDHDKTDFPHTGKHIGLECNKCHRDFQWNGIPHASCVDCHYTKNPHGESITGEQCESCHTTTGFDVLEFDHLERTGFDLAPAHDLLDCASCHTQITDFVGLDSTCEACHADDRPWGHYEGDCAGCHQAENWFPAGLGANDHAITGFALAGAHRLEPCESCHPPGRPRGEAEPDCAACHVRDDPHLNMLGQACADCHTEVSWLRTTFRHTTTGWPLRGTHRLAACLDCHAAGYIATPTECVACHETDAAACVTGCCLDAHAGPEFPDCESCHRVYAWSPVPATAYPHCSN
ncbi:MAG: hypothetical protein ABMB14_15665 [Myxococcota bacterium]